MVPKPVAIFLVIDMIQKSTTNGKIRRWILILVQSPSCWLLLTTFRAVCSLLYTVVLYSIFINQEGGNTTIMG